MHTFIIALQCSADYVVTNKTVMEVRNIGRRLYQFSLATAASLLSHTIHTVPTLHSYNAYILKSSLQYVFYPFIPVARIVANYLLRLLLISDNVVFIFY